MPTVREWLDTTCAAEAPTLPGLRAWRSHDDGIGVRFELDDAIVDLSARLPDEHPAWCALSGVALNVDCEPDEPARVHAFLTALRDRLVSAAPDALRFATEGSALAIPPTSHGRRQKRVGPALAAELARAAYVACRIFEEEPRYLPSIERHDGERASTWRTMVLEEFYPYMGALGVPLEDDDVLEGWARTAARMREGAAPEGLDLYVHVPFCTVQCRFCYCAVSTDVSAASLETYVDHLVRELETFGPALRGVPVRTVFVGGGTPSLLSPRQIERFFGAMHEQLSVAGDAQITVETNPDSLTRERLEALVRVGRMNRLTMGVQSLDPETQRRMDRYNDAERIRRLAASARQLGVRHLNVDVIAGLDGQSLEAFQHDVRFALSLEPDSFHLSPFRPVHAERLDSDPAQVERRLAMMAWASEVLGAHGLAYRKNLPASRRAESVNEQIHRFHRVGSSLLGIGASAYSHSFGSHFYERPFQLAPTLAQIRRGKAGAYVGLASDAIEEAHRSLVHGLFERVIARAPFRALFGKEPWDAVPDAWQKLEELGVVEVTPDEARFHLGTHADIAVARVLLFGPRVNERIAARWDREYDARVDWRARVEALCRHAL